MAGRGGTLPPPISATAAEPFVVGAAAADPFAPAPVAAPFFDWPVALAPWPELEALSPVAAPADLLAGCLLEPLRVSASAASAASGSPGLAAAARLAAGHGGGEDRR